MERKGVEKICVMQSGLAERFAVLFPHVYEQVCGPFFQDLWTIIPQCVVPPGLTMLARSVPHQLPKTGFFFGLTSITTVLNYCSPDLKSGFLPFPVFISF